MTNFENQILSQLSLAAELKIVRIMEQYGIHAAHVEWRNAGYKLVSTQSGTLVVSELLTGTIVEEVERDHLLVHLAKEYRG